IKKESIGDMAQRFLRDKLSIRDVRAEAHALALSAKNANAGSSRLSRLHVGVTGYAKNRGQPDIPRKFRSMEKGQERAKELLTWIQNTISSGRMGDPGKPGAKWFNRFLKDYNL
ncbi:13846_t:CDS:2, partial [Entrophospora sp. SA101]